MKSLSHLSIDVANILSAVNIVDVISSHVALKKKGSGYFGCCPFHSEKTPSFHVNSAKQFYHCFGCGASGDAIQFVREYFRLDFREACRHLVGDSLAEISTEELVASKARKAELVRLAAEEQALVYAEVAAKAERLWAKCRPIDIDHPYLRNKAIRGYGMRQLKNSLVARVCNADGKLTQLQFIRDRSQLTQKDIDEGREGKTFLTGGQLHGCWSEVGERSETILIAEGIATRDSLLESVGYTTLAAFSNTNLMAVALAVRENRPSARLVFCADNDQWKSNGNPGVKSATEAAAAVGGFLAVPEFNEGQAAWFEGRYGGKPTDFNDLFRIIGVGAVRTAVELGMKKGPITNPKFVVDGPPTWMEPEGKAKMESLHERPPFHGKWTTIKESEQENKESEQENNGIVLIQASTLEPEPIHWLWKGWIPSGKLTILAGKPSAGKTIVALEMAAIISRGGGWPDGTLADPGGVLIWTGEDGIKDTIIPRLMACNADLNNIFIIDGIKEDGKKRSFDPAFDCQSLLMALAKMSVKPVLLIVDSIASAISGDSNKNNDTRRGLQPLVDIGELIRCAILGITHFSKNSKGNTATDRVNGSVAFGAVARMVLVAGRITDNPDEDTKRVLTRSKTNIAPEGGGFEYVVVPTELPNRRDIETVCIAWGGAITGHSDDIIARTDNRPSSEDQAELTECANWLIQTLRPGGKMKNEIIEMAGKEGYSKDQIRYAKKRAGVFSEMRGYPAKAFWSLVPCADTSKKAQ